MSASFTVDTDDTRPLTHPADKQDAPAHTHDGGSGPTTPLTLYLPDPLNESRRLKSSPLAPKDGSDESRCGEVRDGSLRVSKPEKVRLEDSVVAGGRLDEVGTESGGRGSGDGECGTVGSRRGKSRWQTTTGSRRLPRWRPYSGYPRETDDSGRAGTE